jgi:membrane-bound ClpP family serine protease
VRCPTYRSVLCAKIPKRREMIIGFIIARILGIIMLILAIGKNPYIFYKLLRVVIFIVSIFCAYMSDKFNNKGWVWIFGIVAFLFNPILPIYLNKNIWVIIDIIVIISFILSFFLLKNEYNSN